MLQCSNCHKMRDEANLMIVVKPLTKAVRQEWRFCNDSPECSDICGDLTGKLYAY